MLEMSIARKQAEIINAYIQEDINKLYILNIILIHVRQF